MKTRFLLVLILSGFLSTSYKATAQAVNINDSLALVNLYNNTNGAAWTNHTNWLTASPAGTWFGVTVQNGRVASLQLSGNSLAGNLTDSLGNLSALTVLNLGGNKLSGGLPATLGNLANLQRLYLYANQLGGSIPSSIGKLYKLRYLSLAQNNLTGSIPASLGNLTLLQNLSLQNNHLSGVIPPYLSNLTSLDTGNINNNYFTFSGIECPFVENKPVSYWGQDTLLPIYKSNTKLFVKAGGSAANNTYQWYNGAAMVKTIKGDSSFTPVATGSRYSVTVTSTITPKVILYSDTFAFVSIPSGPTLDSLALVDLYDSTNGPAWTNHTGWLTSRRLNTWYGVTLDSNRRVIQLYMQGNGLFGTIPASLGNLANLQMLALGYNKLTGNIPNSLSNLTNLQVLYLLGNSLNGAIPGSFGNLVKLLHLDMSFNKLSGSIPQSFSKLINLQILVVNNNLLTGEIPSFLANFTQLQALYLGNNKLSGGIPSFIGNLPNLIDLDLSFDQLTGPIPASFGNLKGVEYLELSSNRLSGPIPDSLPTFVLGGFAKLASNKFTFSGMEGIAKLNIPPPNLTYAPQDTILPIHINAGKLYVAAGGTLANNTYKWYNGTTLVKTATGDSTCPSVPGGDFSVKVTNSVASQLTLTGSGFIVPDYANRKDSLALVDLYDSTNGPGWTNHTGWLTGPVVRWFGIILDTNGRVINIHLIQNNLKGKIPSSLGNLVKLQSLNLTNNTLAGSIPASFGNFVNLQNISLINNSLNGSIPASLGHLANLQNLLILNNQLSGSIPDSLGSLKSLIEFNAENNQLTGEIPSSFGNLAKLQYLYLDKNRLTGTIPAELGNLSKLSLLFLNDNKLTGAIPSAIGNLANLQYLYLHDNMLSGAIPASIANLTKLQFLYLNNNLFTFDGLEMVAQLNNIPQPNRRYAPQDTILPLHKNGNKLSVSAGGTLSNNTYTWYKNGTFVASKAGDSVYPSTGAGYYFVSVSNHVAFALALSSDTLSITGFVGSAGDGGYSSATAALAKPNTRMLVYPNPVQNSVSVVFTAPVEGKYTITVTDVAGKTVKSVENSLSTRTNTLNIDLRDLAKGVYFITITNKANMLQTVKLLKQ